jgi:hypothetical protein
MRNSVDADALRAILERHGDDYRVFALRMKGKTPVAVGDTLPPSRRWWEGEPIFEHSWIREEDADLYRSCGYDVYPDRDAWCYDNLCYMEKSDFDHILAINPRAYTLENGTCGIGVQPDKVEESLALIAKYKGDELVLIGGQFGLPGYDKGEVIIPEAKVVAIL